jgi:hypothetical protein
MAGERGSTKKERFIMNLFTRSAKLLDGLKVFAGVFILSIVIFFALSIFAFRYYKAT